MPIKLKRIYEDANEDDGYRVLVDRIWARGMSKERAQIDLWLKEIAPSTKLRKWFGHAPERWTEFIRRYHAELDAMPDTVQQLRNIITSHETVTLIYSAKDEQHNQAVALRDYLTK